MNLAVNNDEYILTVSIQQYSSTLRLKLACQADVSVVSAEKSAFWAKISNMLADGREKPTSSKSASEKETTKKRKQLKIINMISNY